MISPWLWSEPCLLDGYWYTALGYIWIFHLSYFSTLFTLIDLDHDDDCFGNTYVILFATLILNTKYNQANIYNVAFNRQHLALDQQHDLFNVLLIVPLEPILTWKLTMASNQELSWWIIMFTLSPTQIMNPL